MVPTAGFGGVAIFGENRLAAEAVGDVAAGFAGEAERLGGSEFLFGGLDTAAQFGARKQALQDLHQLNNHEDTRSRLLHLDLFMAEQQQHMVDHHVRIHALLHRLGVLRQRVFAEIGDAVAGVLSVVGGNIDVERFCAERRDGA